MKVAIIAHHHHTATWDDNILAILSCVQKTVNQVVLVTSREDMPKLPAAFSNVTLIRRPNIGYDFYSYRVGLTYVLKQHHKIDGVFLINSSFVLLHSKRFSKLLSAMQQETKQSTIRGVVDSHERAWHLHSYLIYFDLNQLPPGWLQAFFENVQPKNSKSDVIMAYEVGLGRAITRANISTDVLFKPSAQAYWRARARWLRGKILPTLVRSLTNPSRWKTLKGINWAYFAAEDLAKQFGIVKTGFVCAAERPFPLNRVLPFCEETHKNQVTQFIQTTTAQNKALKADPTVTPRTIPTHTTLKKNVTVAVVLHLYYLDLLEEILDYLKNIKRTYHLYITTPFEADVPNILNILHAYKQTSTIMLIENKGRDVAPFLNLYRSGALDNYDAVLKLHSKKSTYDKAWGKFWRAQLYEALCGSPQIAEKSIALLETQQAGMVGPEKYFIKQWGDFKNQKNVLNILSASQLPCPKDETEFGFFAGTMFWFSPKALKRIHTLPALAFEFAPEAKKQDGTLAHAWERLFSLLCRANGAHVTTIELAGKDVFETGFYNAKLPAPPGFRFPKPQELKQRIRAYAVHFTVKFIRWVKATRTSRVT